MNSVLKRALVALFALFCFAYPFAVVGIAFDVHSPFSLAWAGSAFLFLEGVLLVVAAMLVYGWLRGLCAGLIVIALSYGVEALGVGTGFPFGTYRYTDILFPNLPGSVPLAVMFAWLLIVFGVCGWLRRGKRELTIWDTLLGAILATLLDLEIEPVATHLEHYWEWQAPGRINYYGVPLANFAAWFVVAFVLLVAMRYILAPTFNGDRSRTSTSRAPARGAPTIYGEAVSRMVGAPLAGALVAPTLVAGALATATPVRSPVMLAIVIPRILYVASLFMFGLIDLTHGYYLATVLGLLAVAILFILSTLPDRAPLAVPPADRVEQNQAFQHDGKGM